LNKGKKLYEFLYNKIIDKHIGSGALSPSANSAEEAWEALSYLEDMTDEELERIINN
jgi:hypothetical protein